MRDVVVPRRNVEAAQGVEELVFLRKLPEIVSVEAAAPCA
jgi:hypothetical protein